MAQPPKNKKRPPQGLPAPFPWVRTLQVVAIVIAVGVIYLPEINGDWLWDDDVDISGNAIVQSPTGLWAIWFEPGSQLDYYPLKATVQWVQWHFFAMDTMGYHLTNMILHLAGALLVWRLLVKFGLKFAWLGGLLFAVHPVNVESVAWIAELKNTLSLPPFLLAMCAWIEYEKQGRRRDYLLALGLFIVAMLCKTTMVMFPLVILLYAWWKRGRVAWGDLKASAPFFVVSLVLGLVTIYCEIWYSQAQDRPLVVVPMGGLWSRLALTGLSLSFYLRQSLFPWGLSPIYVPWAVDPPTFLQLLLWPLWGVILGGLWIRRSTWGRHVLLGFGFFLLNLAPFLGFMGAPYMEFAWVMDHFLYIPIIGLIGLVVAGLGRLQEFLSPALRPWSIGLVALYIGGMACGSFAYAGIFLGHITMWTYTLQQNPQSWLAHNNLGVALMRENRLAEAEEQYRKANQAKANYPDAENNLGDVLTLTKRYTEAIQHYETALKIQPNYPQARYNFGNALLWSGKYLEAIAQYRKALELDPHMAPAYNNIGVALIQLKRYSEAREQFEIAAQMDLTFPDPRDNLVRLNALEAAATPKK
jgi:predicted negative regulator of RcsB-dependent stress response